MTSAIIGRVKRYIRESGLSQRQVARELGISQGTLNKILQGASPYSGEHLKTFEATCDKWLDAMELAEDNLFERVENAISDTPRYLQRRVLHLYIKHLEQS